MDAIGTETFVTGQFIPQESRIMFTGYGKPFSQWDVTTVTELVVAGGQDQ